MEGEIDRSQFKHVCKFCNKRYPSGKSLGGHMRSHVIANAQKAKALLKINNNNINNKAPTFNAHDFDSQVDLDLDVDENGGGGHSGYGLRENPKKTWRAANHNQNQNQNHQKEPQQQQPQQEIRVCKQCGKAFQSVKALCGHMSSHSEREMNFKDVDDEEDDQSWSSETHSADDHNHHNINLISSSSKRQTRSSYSRYTTTSLSNNSEIDQHQQEEVAICLMMLSRDHHHHHNHSPQKISTNYFNFAPESSDNNSVILEGGSSSNHLGRRKDLNFMNNNKFKEVGMSEKVINVGQEMDNSDSGYFENGAKELESDDDSVHGNFVKNYYNQFGSGLVDSCDGSKKRFRDNVGGFSFDQSPESEENCSKNKINKFECGKCNETFKTYQALGGHIISSHRKNNNVNDLEGKNKGVTSSKKVKGHKCPYCPRVFKSGQALGGHKRSHMMGGGASHRAPPPKPEAAPPPMIDLNLPAPLEEEASGNSEFVAW